MTVDKIQLLWNIPNRAAFLIFAYIRLEGDNEISAYNSVNSTGNRGMVTPYVAAQRHFMAGKFETALGILEELHATDKADPNTLTLLGNVYRQLGMLDQSDEWNRGVVDVEPVCLAQRFTKPQY